MLLSLVLLHNLCSSSPQMNMLMYYAVSWSAKRTWCLMSEVILWRNLWPLCTTTSSMPIINVSLQQKLSISSPSLLLNNINTHLSISRFSPLSERWPQCAALRVQLLPVWAWGPGDEAEPAVLWRLQWAMGPARQTLHTQDGESKYQICLLSFPKQQLLICYYFKIFSVMRRTHLTKCKLETTPEEPKTKFVLICKLSHYIIKQEMVRDTNVSCQIKRKMGS